MFRTLLRYARKGFTHHAYRLGVRYRFPNEALEYRRGWANVPRCLGGDGGSDIPFTENHPASCDAHRNGNCRDFGWNGIWGYSRVLKARLNINEIVTTLMLNYVAYLWVEYFVVVGPWSLGDFELTGQFTKSATWPRLTEYVKEIPVAAGLTAHPGIFLGIAAALLLTWILYRSRWGYEIRVIGNNPKAARYAGIDVARNIILVMGLSGALAGLAGMNEVAAQRELNGRFQRGLGFTGVIVAWLARLNPIAAILVAILFGALLVGTQLI